MGMGVGVLWETISEAGVAAGVSTGTGVGVGAGVETVAVLASGAELKRDWIVTTIRFQTCGGDSSYFSIK